MKQKLLLLVMGLFVAVGTIKADDVYFSSDRVDVMQGRTAEVTMFYNSWGDKGYKGAQVEFMLPDGFEVTKCELGPEVMANNPEMSLEFNTRRSRDNHTVFLLSQVALTDMPMGEGIELFSFTIVAPWGCELGEYQVETLKLELASSDGKNLFEPKEIVFNVVPYSMTILDDTNINLPESSESPEDVLVRRNVKSNVWSTLCLPFEMSREQLEEIFGESMKLAEFVGTEINEDFLQVNFEETDELEANHPYLIKSENEMSEFTVKDVMVSPDEDDAYNGVQESNGVFRGTLKADSYTSEKNLPLVYIKDNKFYYNMASITMNAFRGYFEFEDFEPSQLANALIAVDNEPTTIDGLIINGHEMVSGDVYNVFGTYMGRAENVMDGLPHGVYVINNKKVVIK